MRNSVLAFLAGLVFLASCKPSPAAIDISTFGKKSEYTGSISCKSCHETAYAEWTSSDHYLAMQPASDSTVLGDFRDVSFTSDGVTSRFYKEQGKFIIYTEGEDGQYHAYEVLYTFGYFPLQQYLIAFPGGRMQASRVSWNSRDKRWFHQYAGQKVDHRDWLHWTGNSQNWNTMCATCHSTDLRKNYDPDTDTYSTTWKEINVSCESCHGPGSRHIAYVNSPGYQQGQRIAAAALSYGRDTVALHQLNACAACHTRKSDIAADRMMSGELLDDMIPQVISNEYYFPDGQIRDEDYEYGSFTQSKMFNHNVRCSNCHNPHTGKTKLAGNDLCLSCHQPKYNAVDHHHHQMGTEGALCVNCHMTTRTYMGADIRRDHSFRVPRPDQSVAYDTPNACTQCHTTRSDAWAAAAVVKWYGSERKYHFSDDLLPGSLLNEESEEHLVRLLTDTLQPFIARATAAYYLGNVLTRTSGEALLKVLQDSKAIVRYYALRSLESFPPEIWQQHAYASLEDSVRAVRIAAGSLYHTVPAEAMSAAIRASYVSADKEHLAFLEYQTDFAVGNVMMADYRLRGGALEEAIQYYERGLRKDSLMNYVRLHLAVAYSSLGKTTQALQTLKEAASIDPFNSEVFFNMALLEVEMNEQVLAKQHFEKAIQLGSDQPALYYNFGLLLLQQEDYARAEKILLRGYGLAPEEEDINYALAYYYLQKKQPEKALPFGRSLRALHPDFPEYQEMFRILGL